MLLVRLEARRFDANYVVIAPLIFLKKRARMSATPREDTFKFTSASESEKLPPAAGGSAPHGAIGVEAG